MATTSGRKAHFDQECERSPNHCVLLNRPDLPVIAVPFDSKEGFENAFLVTGNTLQDLIETLVSGSATLKAWFALKLPHVGPKGESAKRSMAPQWGPIWALITKQQTIWSSQYSTNATRWELHEPSSVGELYALAMMVLYRKTEKNPYKNDAHNTKLKWHKFYNTSLRRYFLLYNFLVFLDSYCTGEGAIQFDRPTKDERLPAWNRTRGSRMNSAAQKFQICQ